MNKSLSDYQAVSLIYADSYSLLFRGHKASIQPSPADEVLIRQWVEPHLFSDDCQKRMDMYAITCKKSTGLAKLLSFDFASGRYIFEPFSCSLSEHSRFLEDGSPVWERAWHDACIALLELHTNYLNHGNLTEHSFYFKKDGQLKIGGIFPYFNDNFKETSADKTRPAQGRNFLEREFKKDITALCNIFLSEPYKSLIPPEDSADAVGLLNGKITLEQAKQYAVERFIINEKVRQQREQTALQRALNEKIHADAKQRKKPIFLIASTICGLIILAVIGGKYYLDSTKPYIPALPSDDPRAKIRMSEINNNFMNESENLIRVKTPEVLPGREISDDIKAPPRLTAAPEKKYFVGRVVAVMGPQIDVFNPNEQKKISFIMDDETKVIYADGSVRRQTEIHIAQELEIEYEPGFGEEKAYIYTIHLQE